MSQPEYIFEHGKVYTMLDGQVVSSVHEADFAEEHGGGDDNVSGHDSVEMPDPPADIQDDLGGLGGAACPQCQAPTEAGDQFCAQCGSPVQDQQQGAPRDPTEPNEHQDGMAAMTGFGPGLPPPAPLHGASTVTTPNGLTGTVLGKTASLWGEEVTVRFENGRIVKLPVSEGMKFHTPKTASAPSNPVEALEARLAASPEGDRASLVVRATELKNIVRDTAHRIASVSDFETETALDSLRSQAQAEIAEVKQAIAHIDNAEAMQAPNAALEIHPRGTTASMGRKSGDWLDHSLRGMIAEAEATDYEKLMDEGPEAFVAGLTSSTLANSGVTRAEASRWIASKTAAANPDIRKKYESVWLERVEQVRKVALSQQKQVQHKQAASNEVDLSNLPDDVLFT